MVVDFKHAGGPVPILFQRLEVVIAVDFLRKLKHSGCPVPILVQRLEAVIAVDFLMKPNHATQTVVQVSELIHFSNLEHHPVILWSSRSEKKRIFKYSHFVFGGWGPRWQFWGCLVSSMAFSGYLLRCSVSSYSWSC